MKKENEVQIEFTQWNPDGTRVELTFTEDEDELDVFRFHDICKRFAAAVGYMDSSIEKAFGETKY